MLKADHPLWVQLVTGKKSLTSSKLAVNLLVQSIKMSYERDKSDSNVKILSDRAFQFYLKNEKVFGEEFAKAA